jgi:putative transposase
LFQRGGGLLRLWSLGANLWLNERRYVQYINSTYRRTGTLRDSLYQSSLIQAETYLLSCQRYMELNPVRAVMVDDPAHYRWTHYRLTPWGKPTRIFRHTHCTSRLGKMTR